MERTYAECLRRAETLLFEGHRVLVDASLREEALRRLFLDEAERWGVPGLFVLCLTGPQTVRGRHEGRRGDASDADWQVYLEAAGLWEQPGSVTRPVLREIANDGEPELAHSLALG